MHRLSETAEPESSSTVETRVVVTTAVRPLLSAAPAAGAPLVIGRLGAGSAGTLVAGRVGNITRARLHTHCLLYLSRPLLSRSLPILREYAV
jgi:hypothetical protein